MSEVKEIGSFLMEKFVALVLKANEDINIYGNAYFEITDRKIEIITPTDVVCDMDKKTGGIKWHYRIGGKRKRLTRL